MSWTYSGDPSTNQKDAVRFAIGDTVSADPILQDEEINYLLAQKSSINGAAYEACIGIVARFSRLADKTAGKVKISYSQKAKQYQKLSDTLLSNASTCTIPYAGGISVVDNEAAAHNTNLVQPSFIRGMFDN